MSVDATAEQDAILARAKAGLVGGRVYDSLPDETELERDPDSQQVLPYIVITFGALYPSPQDRTIEGAEQQPQIMPIVFECWAAIRRTAGQTAGAVRTSFLGWAPDPSNASEIDLRGGGYFQSRDANGRPTRYMESVTGSCLLNMNFDAA